MNKDVFEQLAEKYPFITLCVYAETEYLGIIQNRDEVVTTIYDFGKIQDLDLDVIWKDFKVYPSKPFHLYSIDKTQVVIYAESKTAKYYRKKVEKEIEKIINVNYERSRKILKTHWNELMAISQLLLEEETLDIKDIEHLLKP